MKYPDRNDIISAHKTLSLEIIETPVVDGGLLLPEVDSLPSSILLKLELFQRTNSFKIRGALNLMRSLSPEQLKNGIVAFSAGNHAIATAYAAEQLGVSAKVVMPQTANPLRVSACKSLGVEVLLVEKRTDAPELAKTLQEKENRTLVPPFEHPKTVEGTATLGYEFIKQAPNLDLVLVPIGGGGLAAGMGCAIKQFAPQCKIIGVQPKSADAMYRSFKTGKPEFNENVDTVADSLCPPQVGRYTFEVCRQFLDDVWVVDEADTKRAMRLLFEKYRLIVEGAGAISLGGLLGAPDNVLHGKNIGIIVSGSNIDLKTFSANCGLYEY